MIQGVMIPDHPVQIHIEITSQCNLACGFCPVHRMERGQQLSKQEILDCIRQAAEFRPDYVDFINYNEPEMVLRRPALGTRISTTSPS